MKNIVVLTGAGISASAGLKTFRGSQDSLWNNYKIEDVCTSLALKDNPNIVYAFYNQRRKEYANVTPTKAHILLKELEEYFNVNIITTNIDTLHQQAGSTNVLNLHGRIDQATVLGKEFNTLTDDYDTTQVCLSTDLVPNKQGLRPHVVLFGEDVSLYNKAEKLIKNADIVLVIGTSLSVSPANFLVEEALELGKKVYIITLDLSFNSLIFYDNFHYFQKTADEGTDLLVKALIKDLCTELSYQATKEFVHIKTGNVYKLITVSNIDSTSSDFIPTAVYQSLTDFKIWSRPVSEFLRKFKLKNV